MLLGTQNSILSLGKFSELDKSSFSNKKIRLCLKKTKQPSEIKIHNYHQTGLVLSSMTESTASLGPLCTARGKEQLISSPPFCSSKSHKCQVVSRPIKFNWDKWERHISHSMKDMEGANLQEHVLHILLYWCVLVYWCTSPWECLWRWFLHTFPSLPTQPGSTMKGSPLQSSHSSVAGNSWEPCKTSFSHSILATLDGVCLCERGEREEGEWCGAVGKHWYKYVHFRLIFTIYMYSTLTYCFLLFFSITALVFYETTNLQIFTQVPRIRNDRKSKKDAG